MSYYQMPQTLSGYSHSPFGSGFSIPTSNSRPTSPQRDLNGTTGIDGGNGGGMDQGGGAPTAGGSEGLGTGPMGGYGRMLQPANAHPVYANRGMNGIPGYLSAGHNSNRNEHDVGPGGSMMSSSGSHGSNRDTGVPMLSQLGGHYQDVNHGDADGNSLLAGRKRQLSNVDPPPSGPSSQRIPSNGQPSSNSRGGFLTGLRGAEDLGSGDDDDESGEESDERGTEYSGTASGNRGTRENSRVGKRRDGESSKKKVKLTRGSRACTVCRRLKMKCVEADIENGVRCLRCRNGNLECIFEESMRGKRSSKGKKSEIMAKNLKEMENTLETVLRSLHNPKLSLASGMTNVATPKEQHIGLDASPGGDVQSPSAKDLAGAEALPAHFVDRGTTNPSRPGISPLSATNDKTGSEMGTSPGNMPSGRSSSRVGNIAESGATPKSQVNLSPRLHALPDDTLNPLGLLAEASLQNRKRSNTNGNAGGDSTEGAGPSGGSNVTVKTEGTEERNGSDSARARAKSASHAAGATGAVSKSPLDPEGDDGPKGVGNASYFRPGPMSSLGLRKVIIEREVSASDCI